MTKLEKFITKATPSNISKLSNKMLKKLNNALFLANTLSTKKNRKQIELVQKHFHNEMYKRGGFGVIQPKI
tara:strand:+ start:282 stop:494 length:213 start_codon:yes stop_codon:yes gene_type:complete